MSDMEQAVEPILRPMIMGEATALNTTQQDIVTKWLIKTGMVLDSMSSEATFYEESERFQFRETHLSLGYLALWLGRYSGSHWSGFTRAC